MSETKTRAFFDSIYNRGPTVDSMFTALSATHFMVYELVNRPGEISSLSVSVFSYETAEAKPGFKLNWNKRTGRAIYNDEQETSYAEAVNRATEFLSCTYC